MKETAYDYIVAGAGSAGCVVATRLVERGARVLLLLEADGGDGSLFVRMPAALGRVIPVKTWDYLSEPDPATGNRAMTIAQGKLLGGSSSVNGMIYIRGQREDYDAWASEHGCDGWSYADLLPWFRQAEGNESLAGPFHGSDGPLAVSENRYRHPLTQAFVRAGQDFGLPYVTDFNGADQAGVGYYQTTTRRGERASASRTYLPRVAGNPNLRIVTGALVQRVVIEGDRATGVTYSVGGTLTTARASREVIVSAGANGSPKILMLSGVGPAAHLAEAGVRCVADLPVGRHWQDHLHLSVNASLRAPLSLYGQDRGLAAVKNGLEWLGFRSGVITSNILEGAAFVDTCAQGRPDVQIHFLPVLDTWDDPDGVGKHYTHGLTLKVGHLQPKSRGEVRLRSADPHDAVRIDAHYLHHPDDVAGQIRAVQTGLRFLKTPALRELIDTVFSPGPAPGQSIDALEHAPAALEAFVRQHCKTVYHPVGSCRMGPAPADSVVDLSLRVHGIEALRVIDASVFPSIPSGNTNAPVIAVAEKAASLLAA